MMDVEGMDVSARAYRVRVGAHRALVPETLIGAAPRHQDAYEWLALKSRPIEAAIADLAAGRSPRAPYDQIRLAEA
ncbi:MAG: hypothetical protein AAF618_07135 [Pseudomonadota bacterium]